VRDPAQALSRFPRCDSQLAGWSHFRFGGPGRLLAARALSVEQARATVARHCRLTWQSGTLGRRLGGAIALPGRATGTLYYCNARREQKVVRAPRRPTCGSSLAGTRRTVSRALAFGRKEKSGVGRQVPDPDECFVAIALVRPAQTRTSFYDSSQREPRDLASLPRFEAARETPGSICRASQRHSYATDRK
jgi:hypothetical protein